MHSSYAYNKIPNLRFYLWFQLGFMSAGIQAVTKLQGAQSSTGKDISETGAILNHGSLSTCKLDLDYGYGVSVCVKPLMFVMSKPTMSHT